MNKSWNRREWLGATAAGLGATAAWPSLASTEGPIVIGQSIPLTGFVAPAFQAALQGQQLALDTINRKGGINGRKLKLVQLDDAFDPRRTYENVVTLIDKEKVVVLTGLGNTQGVASVLPLLLEKKVPLFGAYTGSHVLRQKHHPYFYTTAASYTDEVIQCVRHMMTLRQDRIAVVFQNNEFGKLMLPIAEQAIKAQGGTMVAATPMAMNGSDVLGAAQATAAKEPLAVLMIGIAGPSVVGYVKAHKAFASVPLYTIGTAAPALPYLGEDARGLAITQISPYPWRQTNPAAREYAKETERANQTISYGHNAAFLMFMMLSEGIRRAGKNVTPQSVNRGIEGMKLLNVDGGPDVRFTPTNHHPVSFVEITIVGPRGTFIR